MPSWAQRMASAPSLESRGVLFLLGIRFQETVGIEVTGVRTPEGGVGVHDGYRHLDDGSGFEEVLVVEERVFEHHACRGTTGVEAEGFLEGG